MDPNNNQPINTNQLQQPVTPQPTPAPITNNMPLEQQPMQSPTPTSAPAAPPAPTSTTTPEPIAQTTKKGSKKGIILLMILVLLILGMGSYVFFMKNQINTAQKASIESKSVVIPTIVPTATPATIEELNIASPDADINGLEQDVQGL